MGDSTISTSMMDYNYGDECERWPRLFGTRHTHPFKWHTELKRQRYGQSYSFKVDLFSLNRNKTLYQRDVKGHTGCVNAVEFNKDGTLIASGGDDLRVLIWNAHDAYSATNPKPRAIMNKTHFSNIFTLAFSKDSRRIFSAGNDGYLIVHDIETKEKITTFDGSCFYSISLRNDDDNVVAAATDAGRIYLFDVRQSPNDPVQTIREHGEMYCVAFNPKEPYYLASCNKLKGLSIFDVRVSDNFFKRANFETKRTIFASWDSVGEGLFCIRSGGTPYYLNTNKSVPLVFSDPKYRNKVTIKSCELVNDEYGFSGSDDWNIYCWKVPRDYDEPRDEKQTFVKLPETEKALTVLKGHRSIVNHVRHSPTEDTIISSGVEKIVKVWSGYELPGSVRDPPKRQKYAHHTVVNSNPDDEEEDAETLRMFDSYVNHDSSDSDDMEWNSDDHPVLEDFEPTMYDERSLRQRLLGMDFNSVTIRQFLNAMGAEGINGIPIAISFSSDDDETSSNQADAEMSTDEDEQENFDFPPMADTDPEDLQTEQNSTDENNGSSSSDVNLSSSSVETPKNDSQNISDEL